MCSQDEARLKTLPGVDDVTITYATKQMKLSARRPDDLIPTIKKTIDAMEDGITIVPKSMPKAKVYILEGLDCANCAAKIEAKLRTLPNVEDVTITYATKQMKLYAKRPDDLIPEIKKTIDAMEDGITIIPKEEAKKETAEKEEKKSAIRKIQTAGIHRYRCSPVYRWFLPDPHRRMGRVRSSPVPDLHCFLSDPRWQGPCDSSKEHAQRSVVR